MGSVIKIGMADLSAARDPSVLITLGLGSCVGICLYDPINKIIGMAHVMLPSSADIKNNGNKAKFADTAINVLIEHMSDLGANRSRLTAKIAGGAQMFSFKSANDLMRIGERNVEAVKRELEKHSIPVIAEDVGGNYGRSIEFDSANGELRIKTIGHGKKTI
ncbi:MAG: chemotaxis protein CheD [Bacillota bacterium]|nr:chemotaxis protein CheD [Bacillota bacterium]